MNMTIEDSAFIPYVVETYSDMIVRIAYQSLQSQAEAEDVAQDVFMRLLQQRSFQNEAHMKAWLIRVTVNRCKDVIKSSWFRTAMPLSEETILFSEEQKGILAELWTLSKNDRTVLYLYYYEGYSVPEISKILKTKENTISSRLTRARKKLKEVLLKGAYQYE